MRKAASFQFSFLHCSKVIWVKTCEHSKSNPVSSYASLRTVKTTTKMVGKRRSAANKKASPAPITDSLVCIYCRERVSFGGTLPATEYEAHLGKTCNALVCINTLCKHLPFCLCRQRTQNSLWPGKYCGPDVNSPKTKYDAGEKSGRGGAGQFEWQWWELW